MKMKETERTEIVIDGSQGEGGGQILRTALALSAITGKSFSIREIRAKRQRPGLLRQHLTCVKAMAEVCNAKTEGAELNSTCLRFQPGAILAGNYHWPIGSAGSTSLVLQTVLFPLLHATGSSQVCIEGGTHNSMAPSFEFLELSLQPLLISMGYKLNLTLEQNGFYPAGGGRIRIELVGDTQQQPFQPKTIDGDTKMEVCAWSSNIPDRIGKAEVELIGNILGIEPENRHAKMVRSNGPGNVVSVVVASNTGKRVFTSFGEARLSLEKVAELCISQVQRFQRSGAQFDEHLQDQLLLPLSLGSGGRFTSVEPSMHTKTNMAVIQQFLQVEFQCNQLGPDFWEIIVSPQSTTQKTINEEQS